MSVKGFNPLLFLLVVITDKHCHAHSRKSMGLIFQWYLAPEEQASEMSYYDLSGGLTAKTVIFVTLFTTLGSRGVLVNSRGLTVRSPGVGRLLC